MTTGSCLVQAVQRVTETPQMGMWLAGAEEGEAAAADKGSSEETNQG